MSITVYSNIRFNLWRSWAFLCCFSGGTLPLFRYTRKLSLLKIYNRQICWSGGLLPENPHQHSWGILPPEVLHREINISRRCLPFELNSRVVLHLFKTQPREKPSFESLPRPCNSFLVTTRMNYKVSSMVKLEARSIMHIQTSARADTRGYSMVIG